MNRISYITILIACTFLNVKIQAQNFLEKEILVEVKNQSTESTMFILEKLGGFNFSYDAMLLDPTKMVSIEGKRASLEEILDELFQGRYTYKVIGSHVILQAKNKDGLSNTMWVLSGIITDSNGNPLENAIVYEVNRQASFITNPDGKYILRLEGDQTLGINFSCKGYQDTITYISADQSNKLNIVLHPWEAESIFKEHPTFSQSLRPRHKAINWAYTEKELKDLGMVNLMIPEKSLYVSNNLNVQEVRFAQVSFIPSWGTNRLTNGLVTNKFSLNIIAGYSANIDGVEIGAVANIIRQEMNGIQIGGAVNVVGEDVNGVQVAGAINTNLGSINGVQVAGAINRVKGDIKGLQISGAVNTAAVKSADSLSLKGWNGQVSGGINLHGGERINLQVAGAYNQANSVDGIQVSGAINYVKGTTNGLQLSGLYNRTYKLRGIQVGLINHADTIENGFPIGLVNIIRNGYRKWEFSTDETFYINTTYKTGGKNLYSFLKVGAGKYLNAAYGIGYTTNPDRKFSVNLDLSGSALFNMDSDYDVFAGDIYRAQLGFNFKISNQMVITTGPSYNFCSPDKEQKKVANNSLSSKNSPYFGNYYLDKAVSTLKNQFWFGWQFGIRF
ncbi:STN and carboxypeptidase regulatory-like domain-containing protein [Marinifilum fragile]|uniref:STN and carboxypeptidase regulatory-like domain-containing protein n=1 Tax=Marinifilum fragile TaxID=570161 RepID=UPI002AABA07E|nr:STN and carboxypeptidase regulatory-like domain-containing protein [Marinifilum fragile]